MASFLMVEMSDEGYVLQEYVITVLWKQ